MTKTLEKKINEPDDPSDFSFVVPYTMRVSIVGSADLLFKRWNCAEIETKAASAKGSKIKKTDNVESYVYRDEKGFICMPGEYFRQSIINAAKFRQDPRSTGRKSAKDLYGAGLICLTHMAQIGPKPTKNWDYLDTRRVMVQRNGINRTRPAFSAGWKATFDILVNAPEYISRNDLREVIEQAGRLVGVGDFRPTFGRYGIVSYDELC